MPPTRSLCPGLVAIVLLTIGPGCSVGGEPEYGFPGVASLGVPDDDGSTTTPDEEEGEASTTTIDPWDTAAPATATVDESGDGGSTTDEPGCIGDCVESCFGGLDEDGDGAFDCEDSDCAGHLACTCEVVPDEGFGVHVMCTDATSWTQARDACQASDMHLVSIQSAAHNTWLVQHSQALDPISWWMGFSDLQAEGVWVWVDGAPVDYVHWYPSEPSNGPVTPEHCAAFPEHDAYSWNDLDCALARPFICER